MIGRSALVGFWGVSLIVSLGCSSESSDDPSDGASGAAGAGATSGAGGAASGDCQYAGQSFADGSNFPAADGCNQCSCSDGMVACTAMACAPTAGAGGGSGEPGGGTGGGATGGSGGTPSDCAGQPCGAQACSIEVQCLLPPCIPVGGWCDARGECVDAPPTCG